MSRTFALLIFGVMFYSKVHILVLKCRVIVFVLILWCMNNINSYIIYCREIVFNCLIYKNNTVMKSMKRYNPK